MTVGKYLIYLTIAPTYMLTLFTHYSPNYTPIHSFLNFMYFSASPFIPMHILELLSLFNHAEVILLAFYCIHHVKVETADGVHECIILALSRRSTSQHFPNLMPLSFFPQSLLWGSHRRGGNIYFPLVAEHSRVTLGRKMYPCVTVYSWHEESHF